MLQRNVKYDTQNTSHHKTLFYTHLIDIPGIRIDTLVRRTLQVSILYEQMPNRALQLLVNFTNHIHHIISLKRTLIMC